MIEKRYPITGVTCQHCIKKVQQALTGIDAINHVKFSDDMQYITIQSNRDVPTESMNTAMETFGNYRITDKPGN